MNMERIYEFEQLPMWSDGEFLDCLFNGSAVITRDYGGFHVDEITLPTLHGSITYTFNLHRTHPVFRGLTQAILNLKREDVSDLWGSWDDDEEHRLSLDQMGV